MVMDISIRRSLFEAELFEVLEGDVVIQEIRLPFLGKKFPLPKRFESLEIFLRWAADTERKGARNKVYYLLGLRDYPEVLLARKLKEAGYSKSVSQEALEEAKRLGYIQEGVYEAKAIEKEFRKGYGPRYIEGKLKAQGLSAQGVKQWYTPERQKECAGRLVQKLKKKERPKIIRALQQKGFDLDIILQIVPR